MFIPNYPDKWYSWARLSIYAKVSSRKHTASQSCGTTPKQWSANTDGLHTQGGQIHMNALYVASCRCWKMKEKFVSIKNKNKCRKYPESENQQWSGSVCLQNVWMWTDEKCVTINQHQRANTAHISRVKINNGQSQSGCLHNILTFAWRLVPLCNGDVWRTNKNVLFNNSTTWGV